MTATTSKASGMIIFSYYLKASIMETSRQTKNDAGETIAENETKGGLKIKYATISKIGLRQNNEDAYNVVDNDGLKHRLIIVCDGMGGHDHGEVASEVVTRTMSEYWLENDDTPDSKEKIVAACGVARRVLDRKADSLDHAEMATTMVMASFEGENVTIAHVGDSRCYLVRPSNGLLYQTRDHIERSCGWEFVARSFFAYRPDVNQPEVKTYKIKAGDRLLLCSDGIYKCMAPGTIIEKLKGDMSPEEIINALDSICEKRSDDNYTAILIEVEQED